ncbi:hypothetical protein Gotri_021405, partial [Gossypium trilobum]|nr:hypothetical protein [Gossypium trilobum]
MCPQCNLEVEDSKHVFRDCSVAKAIWEQLDYVPMLRNIPAPFATEGLACLEAVLFPNDIVFQHVVVEGDSQSIISKLGKTKLDESK